MSVYKTIQDFLNRNKGYLTQDNATESIIGREKIIYENSNNIRYT